MLSNELDSLENKIESRPFLMMTMTTILKLMMMVTMLMVMMATMMMMVTIGMTRMILKMMM